MRHSNFIIKCEKDAVGLADALSSVHGVAYATPSYDPDLHVQVVYVETNTPVVGSLSEVLCTVETLARAAHHFDQRLHVTLDS